MSYSERNTFAALIVNIFTTSYMIIKLSALHKSGVFETSEALVAFGKAALWIIPISIAGTIIVSILFNILFSIATNQANPSFVKDERDAYFEHRGIITTMIFIGIGFISTMVVLSMGWTAVAAFTLLYFSFAAGDFFGNIVKIISYRAGV